MNITILSTSLKYLQTNLNNLTKRLAKQFDKIFSSDWFNLEVA